MKGADTVMASMVEYNDWLEEECINLAQKGLRTLVVARKVLTTEQYTHFEVSWCFGGLIDLICVLLRLILMAGFIS